MAFDWLPVARWVHGLVAALVGGGASAVSTSFGAALLAPESFNLQAGRGELIALMSFTFVFNGAMSAMFYLSKQPLPQWDGLDRRGPREPMDVTLKGKIT